MSKLERLITVYENRNVRKCVRVSTGICNGFLYVSTSLYGYVNYNARGDFSYGNDPLVIRCTRRPVTVCLPSSLFQSATKKLDPMVLVMMCLRTRVVKTL